MVLLLIVGGLDASRLVWQQISVNAALAYGVKLAESQRALQVDLSQLDLRNAEDSARYAQFVAARAAVSNEVTRYLTEYSRSPMLR